MIDVWALMYIHDAMSASHRSPDTKVCTLGSTKTLSDRSMLMRSRAWLNAVVATPGLSAIPRVSR